MPDFHRLLPIDSCFDNMGSGRYCSDRVVSVVCEQKTSADAIHRLNSHHVGPNLLVRDVPCHKLSEFERRNSATVLFFASRHEVESAARQTTLIGVLVGVVSQLSITKGERSLLQTHIATTGSTSFCARMKS